MGQTVDITLNQRNIAITDVETTGLDPNVHEIIEIGLVLISQPGLQIVKSLDIKIKPTHIETATPRALEVNGYNAVDWVDAVDLKTAMDQYAFITKDAIFCAHNVYFDLGFIQNAFQSTGIRNLMDYHTIDIPTLAWGMLRHKGIERLNLSYLCKFLDIEPEPDVHRGINGAMSAYRVLQKLIAPNQTSPQIQLF